MIQSKFALSELVAGSPGQDIKLEYLIKSVKTFFEKTESKLNLILKTHALVAKLC